MFWSCRKRTALKNKSSLQSFIEGVRTNGVAEVLIALPSSRAALMDSIVRQMQTLAADIHILPDLGDIQIPLMRLHRTGDLAFITTVSRPIEGWGVFQKRVEDFAVALTGLALAAPVMAAHRTCHKARQ